MDSIGQNLTQMGRFNGPLAHELSKLPEIQRAAFDCADTALNNLLKIYRFSPHRFDRMFQCMHNVGLREFRRYCSPLQALFWIIQDQKMSEAGALLGLDIGSTEDENGNVLPELRTARNHSTDKNFCPGVLLENILDAAWNGEYRSMPASRIHEIIGNLRSRQEADEYALLVTRHSDLQLQGYIMDDFLTKKEIFHAGDWAAIERSIEQSRWKSFYGVADRLNAPELVSYYINRYFFFRKTPASGVYFTFFDRRAQCTDAAYFARFMLDRSGYTTFMRSVKWDEDPWDGLHTGAGIILDNGSYLLVSNYTGINSISGPFSDIQSLDQKISCGRQIVESRWGAYYPPRYY